MKLLIADDHPVLRAEIAALLREIEPNVVVLQAADASNALNLAGDNPDIDLVLLDLRMPGVDGVSAIVEFGKTFPDLPVAVLSSSESPSDVRKVLAAGAVGYIPKSAPPHTLLSAIKLVLQGEIYVPPMAILPEADAPPSPEPETAGASDLIESLTTREVEVLQHLCRGRSNKEIARDMAVSEKTVKAHVSSIFRSLNVVNRTQAARIAADAGLR